MLCNCMTMTEDYSIELVKGDYGSFLYHITNEFDGPVNNIKQVVFTCHRLNLKLVLEKYSEMDYLLVLDSSLTKDFPTWRSMTYDLTLEFTTAETPITLIHNASITILNKENTLNEDDSEDVQS